jgi:hypothetical protein
MVIASNLTVRWSRIGSGGKPIDKEAMSWDISILKFARSYGAITEIPDDEVPASLGTRESVHAAVSKIFANTDWSDPCWGILDASFGSIEFNLGGDDPVDSLMLHVHAGVEVVPMIVQLCRANEWQAIDCSTCDFIEKSVEPEKSLGIWTAYRKQVIGNDDA